MLDFGQGLYGQRSKKNLLRSQTNNQVRYKSLGRRRCFGWFQAIAIPNRYWSFFTPFGYYKVDGSAVDVRTFISFLSSIIRYSDIAE